MVDLLIMALAGIAATRGNTDPVENWEPQFEIGDKVNIRGVELLEFTVLNHIDDGTRQYWVRFPGDYILNDKAAEMWACEDALTPA